MRRRALLITLGIVLASGLAVYLARRDDPPKDPPPLSEAPAIVRHLVDLPEPSRELDAKSQVAHMIMARRDLFEREADEPTRDLVLTYIVAWGRWAARASQDGTFQCPAELVQETFVESCLEHQDRKRLVKLLSESAVHVLPGGAIE